jgi:superfamily I DNA and/or RNA helicase
VTPYNDQIDALKEAVELPKECKDDVRVIGTVNRLQGQEREAIVVSYGVDDAEKAIEHKEFIYSYRRLNVSLTRGECKTIVFLTDELTNYPIELLESTDEDLVKGLDFVYDLRSYMEKSDDDFEAEQVVDKTAIKVYRKRKK